MASRHSFGDVIFTEPSSGWLLVLYPDAGEAGGSWQVPRKRKKSYDQDEEPSEADTVATLFDDENDGDLALDDEWEALKVPTEHMAEPEDEWSSRSAQEAARRARGKVRRFCASNLLNRLGTLTYAGEGCHDMVVVRADIREFFKSLRDLTGRKAFPYLWTTEWHQSGHGLHVHFAVGQYIPRRLIERAWGHGFVHIKLLGDLPVGSGKLAEARRTAGYLSKYVTKNVDDDRRPEGMHRYDVAQGFAPKTDRLRGRTWDDVLAQAIDRMGSRPNRVWRSDDEPTWDGPPAGWLQWPG